MPSWSTEPNRRRALLLSNLHARRVREQVDEASRLLAGHGFELIKERLEGGLDGVIREHAKAGDLVIVAGGDGSLNLAVDALVRAKARLGILPLGTANDLARTLGIPPDLEGACAVLAAGHFKTIDLGWVNGKHYFNVASLGLSVKLTSQITGEVKRRYGTLAYPLAALRVLGRHRPFRAILEYEGQRILVRTMQLTIGNGRHYGGGMNVAHDAAIDDQNLDVYSLEIDHWWRLFPLLRSLKSGRLEKWAQVRTFRTREVKVTTSRPRRINTDGEVTTRTPAHFRVVPHALEVCVPRPSP